MIARGRSRSHGSVGSDLFCFSLVQGYSNALASRLLALPMLSKKGKAARERLESRLNR